MAAYNKFLQFTEDLIDGAHDFDAHVFKVMLTNTAPVNTNTVKANLTEISAVNGYPSGGIATTITTTTSGGTAKATATDVVFTASGGTFGPFRYAVLYNDTTSTPAKPLIAWWDYGSTPVGGLSLLDTETLTVDFDGVNGLFQIT